MAGIDEVFERLVVDTDFRAALARDPHAALVEYDLAPAEVALLASRLDDGDEAQRAVEQRTSKSALLAALGMLASSGEATDGIGADETLTVGGSRTAGPADEYTKVPGPPAPHVPVPYPNTAEADGAIESLELATDGIDVDDTAAVEGSMKSGDITLKRGTVDDGGVASGDALAVSGDDVEGPGDELVQAGAQAGDGKADVVAGAGAGGGPRSPEPDDDMFEIADANEVDGVER